MVGFRDFVRDDVVTVVVSVFELHHVAAGHVGHGARDDPVFTERSVHGGLGGNDVSVSLFERVDLKREVKRLIRKHKIQLLKKFRILCANKWERLNKSQS